MMLNQGDLIAGRYLIERTAGSGGMGTVYRALDQYSGCPVALKLLNSSGDAHESERFIREGRLLAELRHPGIVGYVAHGQDTSGALYLAMDWLEGEDLATRLRRGPLSVSESVLLLRRLAEALSVPHQRSIVHRDIKPSNIFLRQGQVDGAAVLDFGIARRRTGSHAVTRTGALIGTPEYMSPEQARGERELSPATDIFSLGSVLYECLVGQPPFSGEHVAVVLVKILFEEPSALPEILALAPAGLGNLLQSMLAKDPRQRPADARELLASLVKIPLTTATEVMPGFKFQLPTPRFLENEQSLVSMVVATAPAEQERIESGSVNAQNLEPPGFQQSLRDALAQMGAQVEWLLDRTLIATISGTESATDQAAQAARAALIIKERWPGAKIALATGRALTRGQTPIGEVADRAGALLKSIPASSPTHVHTLTGVWLDSTSAGLLGTQFIVTEQHGQAMLTGENVGSDQTRLLLGKPTQCVGREVELGVLENLLAACISDSEATAALVVAPPGIGKSRLRHEFLRRLGTRTQEGTLLIGHASMIGSGQPYSVLADALRRQCGLRGGEPLPVQRGRLQARLAESLALTEAQPIAEFIGEMCGISSPTQESLQLRAARSDPRMMARQISNSVIAFLRSECGRKPVLLVLEDLHWSDALSVRVVEEALAELHEQPLMVLGLARPEVHELFPLLFKHANARVIPLKGLSKRAAERLVIQVLGRDASPERVTQVVEQAHGNVLFLEELIRSAADQQTAALPGTVLAMLQARLGRLEAGARRALRAASVLGTTFWDGSIATLLEDALSATPGQLEGWLNTLQKEELIEQHSTSRFPGQTEYRFRHALMREAAYELLTDEDRHHGHGLAARYLISLDPECRLLGSDLAEALQNLLSTPAGRTALQHHGALFEIAHHLQRSIQDSDRSKVYRVHAEVQLIAAQKAELANAYQMALGHAETGCRLLGEAAWDEAHALCLRLSLKRAEYLYLIGEESRSEELFGQIERHLRTIEDIGDYYTQRVSLYNMIGRIHDAIRIGRDGLSKMGISLPEAGGDSVGLLMAEVAEIHRNLGGRSIAELASAPAMQDVGKRQVMRVLTSMAAPAYTIDPSLFALVASKLTNLGLIYGHCDESMFSYVAFTVLSTQLPGQLSTGRQFFELALMLLGSMQNAALACSTCFGVAVSMFRFRHLKEAPHYYERALALGIQGGNLPYASYSTLHKAVANLATGVALSRVLAQIEADYAIVLRINEPIGTAYLNLGRRFILALWGRTTAATDLGCSEGTEAELIHSMLQRPELLHASYWFYLLKLQLSVLYGSYEDARALVSEAANRLHSAAGFYHETEFSFWGALALAGAIEAAGESEKPALLQQLNEMQGRLIQIAQQCPDNYRHKHLLVRAAIAEVSQDAEPALQAYREAAAEAQRAGYLHMAALAHERMFRLLRSQGAWELAKEHGSLAHQGYLQWEAMAKAQHMAKELAGQRG